jgi:fructokinase
MTLKRDSNDSYPSTCPFHSDCFEGLASGISLDKRYNLSYDELAKRDDLLRREANYIAQGIYNLYLTFAPDKIIIGGGVSHQEKLLPLVREEFEKLNNNYYTYKAVKSVDELIVSPTLKDNSALYGAIALGVIEK